MTVCTVVLKDDFALFPWVTVEYAFLKGYCRVVQLENYLEYDLPQKLHLCTRALLAHTPM